MKARGPKRIAKRSSGRARKAAAPAARTAKKSPARRGIRGVVKGTRPLAAARRPPAPAALEAFPQREGASVKQLVLFEMVRARATFHGAIHGLPAGGSNAPMVEGGWSVKDTVLHLVTRDQARLREMEAVLRGATPSWRDIPDPEMSRINEETLEPLRRLGWEEAVKLLHTTRRHLMEELEMVPEDPAGIWEEGHPFGWMFHVLSTHDRHHAEAVKRWRATREI
jgi:hypothetical protein